MQATLGSHPSLKLVLSLGLGLLLVLIFTLLFARIWTADAWHLDFFPRYVGARYLLFEAGDLYTEQATRAIQLRAYGELIPPDRDQHAFAYPAHIVPLLLPFWLIPDMRLSGALWMALTLVGSIALLTAELNREPRYSSFFALLFFLWQFSLLMLGSAQFTGLPLLALILAWRYYEEGRYIASGLLLSLGSIKPELILLPAALLCLLAIREKRWRFLAAFLGAGLLYLLSSVALAGWWIPAWLDGLRRYSEYAQVAWGPAITLWQGPPTMILAAGALLGCLALSRWNRRWLWLASIPLNLLLVPQTLHYGLTLLLIPMLWLDKGSFPWLAGLIWLAGWVLPFLSSDWQWWRVQMLVMPLLTLLALAYASRLQSTQTQEAQQKLRPEKSTTMP